MLRLQSLQHSLFGVCQMLQVVKDAQELQLAEFSPGDAKGDQLVVVTGPSSRLFATVEDLNELEFVTLLCNGGQESADVQPTDGYSGEDVIAYRSTKVIHVATYGCSFF